jgi:hypothetical protein
MCETAEIGSPTCQGKRRNPDAGPDFQAMVDQGGIAEPFDRKLLQHSIVLGLSRLSS